MSLTALALPHAGRSENRFLQHNLVSDLLAVADSADRNLASPWGNSFSTTSPLPYAADSHGGIVDIYGGDFSPKTLAGAFSDPTIPTGFAPFNVYASGGKVYVAYAKQDGEGHDDVPGDGNGFINVFDVNGKLLQRLVSGGRLNSPWGMAIAPDGFGDFGKSLLVGNFGDGTINAYDPASGTFLGTLQDASGKPLINSGLWGLQF